jgi:hypothetical protein
LTILQPGHAGTGIEFTNESLLLGGPPFIKQKSILTALLRGWPQQAPNPNHQFTLMNTNAFAENSCRFVVTLNFSLVSIA